MSGPTLISYAQNGEDVVLWRALGHVSGGRYVDVGACDPVELSVTKVLYDRGWRGVDIDAVPEYAERLRQARPDDDVVHAAITDRPVPSVVLHAFAGTGLSTLLDETAVAHEQAGYERQEIEVPARSLDDVCDESPVLRGDLHLLKVDVEGAEAEVLRSFDLGRWRPWVVVVEATRPLTSEASHEEWEPLLTEAGYTPTLFDGVSRFYVSPDHPELVHPLSYPACSLDDYVPVRQQRQDERAQQLARELEQARGDVHRWRNEAVAYWASAIARVQGSEDDAKKAHSEAARLRRQVTGVREKLQQSRGDVRRLRAKARRLEARVEELGRPPAPRGGAARRLRRAVGRVLGR